MKVLFITYYWPPCGGVSAQRILYFVKYLAEMGVECHVIVPENPSYYVVDKELLHKIPNDITIHKVPINDVTRFIKKVKSVSKPDNVKQNSKGVVGSILGWIRANCFIPDPKVNWIKPVVNKASDVINDYEIDLIFTNGSPHSVHLAGLKLKNQTDVKWVADFRDPWTGMDYFDNLKLSASSLKKHQALEKRVISTADLTLTVSEAWEKDFKKLGAKNTAHITNGFDDIIHPIPTQEKYISHVGSLHDDRSITPVISYLKKNSSIKLVLVGDVSASINNEIIKELKSDQYLFTGQLSHIQAKKWIAKSSILLLPINHSKDGNGRIPAKMFEYLASGKSILLLGNTEGDAAQLLDEIENAGIFEYANETEIHAFLDEQLSVDFASVDLALVSKFHRKELATTLHEIMKNLLV